MRLIALILTLLNVTINLVFFCVPVTFLAKWIWRSLKLQRDTEQRTPTYNQADLLRSRDRFQEQATYSARESDLRRRQKQREDAQLFASEWLEESRAIEESLRYREEEERLRRAAQTNNNNDNDYEYEDASTLIAEQDAAFKASLKEDQEKEAKKIKEETERKNAEEERKILLESLSTYRAQLREALEAEPDAATQDAVEIAFRFNDGSKQIRRFMKNSPLVSLFNFIEGNVSLETTSWQLFTTYPKTQIMDSKTTNNSNKTIEEVLGAAKKHLLVVEEETEN